MAFPVVEAVNAAHDNANTTTHTVLLPTGVTEGDLLIAAVTRDDIDVNAGVINWPESWNQIAADEQSARTEVRYKVAEVGEADFVVTSLTSAQEWASRTWRISGFELTSPPEAATAKGAGQPDCPNLAPSWGSAETLWIALFGCDTSNSVTGFPTDFTDNQHADNTGGTGGVTHGAAELSSEVSAVNPSAWTVGTVSYVAVTIAVRPSVFLLPPGESAIFNSLVLRGDS